MRGSHSEWIKDKALKSRCDEIRKWLHQGVTTQGGPAENEESPAASVSSKLLVFGCGSARYNENQKCWILRNSRDSSSGKPRISSNRAWASGSCGDSVLAGACRLESSGEQLITPSHNPPIARIKFRDDAMQNSLLPPPSSLIQKLFRTAELKLAFENYGERAFPDLEPVLSYLQENHPRYAGVSGRNQVVQDVISYCSCDSAGDQCWVTEIFTPSDKPSTQRSTRVPAVLRSLLQYCIEDDANIDGEEGDVLETRTEEKTRSKRKDVSPATRKSDRRKVSQWHDSEIRTSTSAANSGSLMDDAIEMGIPVSSSTRKMILSHSSRPTENGRKPRRCLRCVEFNGDSAWVCRGRGGARHCQYFSSEGGTTRAGKSNSLFIKKATEMKRNLKSVASTRLDKTKADATQSKRKRERTSKNASRSLPSWMKLSHLGHVSDYHGVQRQFESFFPLTLKKSPNEMVGDIEMTLLENDFDGILESDEEVREECIAYERAILSYASNAEKEKHVSKRHKGCCQKTDPTPEVPFGDLQSMPVLFCSEAQDLIERRCSDPDTCPACNWQSEDPVRTIHFGGVREVDTTSLESDSCQDQNIDEGRPSRSREIALQRKASLLLLNKLQNNLRFISSYNEADPVDASLHSKSGDSDESSSSSDENAIHTSAVRQRKRKRESDEGSSGPEPSEHEFSDLCAHTLASLSLDKIFSDCVEYSKRCQNVVTFPSRPSLESVREILGAVGDIIADPLTDDDLTEQRNYQRAIRSYNGKADQERIEKLRHEESREIFVSRGRKPTPSESELLAFENRPVHIVSEDWNSTPCHLGPKCEVCTRTDQCNSSMSSNNEAIYHPSARLVDVAEMFQGDEHSQDEGRRNRLREREERKQIDIYMLREFYRKVDFIEQYNNGWLIASSKRSKIHS